MRFLLPLISIALAVSVSLPVTSPAREVEGIVQADKDITISARTENVIVSMEVEEGDLVEADQLLARLDSRTQKLQVALWEKRLELLQVAYESSLNLSRDNIVSREELLTAEIERDLAQIQLEAAMVDLADTELRSAINGVIVEITKEPGEQTQLGEELFRIVNTEIVFIQLYLPAEEAATLSLGQEFVVKFPQLKNLETTDATISFIDPAVDPNSGFQRIRLLLPNPDNNIRTGQRCRVVFP